VIFLALSVTAMCTLLLLIGVIFETQRRGQTRSLIFDHFYRLESARFEERSLQERAEAGVPDAIAELAHHKLRSFVRSTNEGHACFLVNATKRRIVCRFAATAETDIRDSIRPVLELLFDMFGSLDRIVFIAYPLLAEGVSPDPVLSIQADRESFYSIPLVQHGAQLMEYLDSRWDNWDPIKDHITLPISQARLAESGLEEFYIAGNDFSKLNLETYYQIIKLLFKKLDYELVEPHPYWNGEIILMGRKSMDVEGKMHTVLCMVTRNTVDELIGKVLVEKVAVSRQRFDAHTVVLFSPGYFDKNARMFADDNDIALVDYDWIIRLMEYHGLLEKEVA